MIKEYKLQSEVRIMNNFERGPRNPEVDPHLGKDDNIQNSNDANSENKWEETMKDMPSYSEHMEQMQEEEDEMSM